MNNVQHAPCESKGVGAAPRLIPIPSYLQTLFLFCYVILFRDPLRLCYLVARSNVILKNIYQKVLGQQRAAGEVLSEIDLGQRFELLPFRGGIRERRLQSRHKSHRFSRRFLLYTRGKIGCLHRCRFFAPEDESTILFFLSSSSLSSPVACVSFVDSGTIYEGAGANTTIHVHSHFIPVLLLTVG